MSAWFADNDGDANGLRRRARLGIACCLALVATAQSCHAETVLERGAYLVNAVAACATCHTPRMPPGPALSGGNTFGAGDAAVVSPNITPDPETGLGSWTDAQIVAAIRNDIRPDGSRIGPPMPQHAFKAISDTDAAAIVAYLRSVPPIHHAIPAKPNHVQAPTSIATVAVPTPAMTTPIERGRYLATGPAHCVECHAIGAGDATPRVFKGPWGAVSAPTLSPARLAGYTDADFTGLVANGTRPDGTKLVGPMPVKSYARLRPDDVAAILAFLRAPPAGRSKP
jgi:mono/diheme cytochrome c family protein